MQTFLPYPDFAESASVLDNKRLGKQRVECLQILTALSYGPKQCSICLSKQPDVVCYYPTVHYAYQRNTPWYNHPAVKMWKGSEAYLADFSWAICEEWTRRGYKDTCLDKICALDIVKTELLSEIYKPKWLGNESFHASHRSNLLRKDPVHYSQFGWTEPHDLPYIWPV